MASRTGIEGVYLLWIPLGAGAAVPVAHWCGRAYEAASARREHRQRQDLFHAALEIETRGDRYVVEMTPAWGSAHNTANSVASGPVAFKVLGRSRFFRYEVHCWRNGVIPDRDHAVGDPQRLSSDPETAGRILDLASKCPRARWGRDEYGTGDMWNSNSLVAWLLARAGVPTTEVQPPSNGRAPGWRAGLVASGAGAA
jgi:hypothetical protein